MIKPQLVFIHGGNTFKSREDFFNELKKLEVSLEKPKKWNEEYFEENLKDDFEIIKLKMPLKENARYIEWKVYFEKYIPFLKDNLILVGNSLGGIFLAKYLSENKFPKKIISTYLISPPYDNSLPVEDLVGGFELKDDLSLIEKNSQKVVLFFSKDDTIVPISHSENYKKHLKNSKFIICENKNGHFFVPEFPEILEMIKDDLKLIFKKR